MAPIDGATGLKINVCNAYTSDVNISKAQPSKASGLGGVASQRSKSASTLYKYSLKLGAPRPFQLAPAPWGSQVTNMKSGLACGSFYF